MACRLLLIRHGYSIGNLNGVFLGKTDLDLAPKGFMQADLAAEYLSKESVDVIYSSDRIRAYHTAVPFSKLSGLDIIKDSDLCEINAGKWENRAFEELQIKFKASYEIWLTDIGNATPDNGESVAGLQARVVAEVKRIAEENDGKTVALFTHATPIRAFFCHILKKPLSEMIDIPWPTNCSVSEAVFENGTFSAVRYSDDSFIGGYTSSLPENV